MDELKELGKRKGISITVSAEVNSCTVWSDKTYLLLVFENLISNALKFSSRGTSVKIQVHRSDSFVEASVIDEGPGIKPEEEHLLFQKFSMLSARPTGGENSTGIGLSLVKTYIEKLDGSIRYKGKFGEGSTFTVQLPLAS